jgi:hypothetical protein
MPTDPSDLRWLTFVEAASSAPPSIVADILTKALSPNDKTKLTSLAAPLTSLKRKQDDLANDPSRKEDFDSARLALTKAIREAAPSLQSLAQSAVDHLIDDPQLFVKNQPPLLAHASHSPALTDLRAELKRLTNLSILVEQADGTFSLAHQGNALTEADRYYLRQLHLTVVSQVLLPGFLQRSPAPLFVDRRVSSIKLWRDVYRYTSSGEPDGWVRHMDGRTYRFNNDGRWIEGSDPPKVVRYLLKDDRLTFETAIQAGK